MPALKEQVEKQGIAALTDQRWRERVHQTRIDTARNGMAAVLEEMGGTANAYFTPEERLTYASFAWSKRNGMNAADLEKFAIPLAESAALADHESRWRFELLMQQAGLPNYYANAQPFIELQRRRGRFAELGPQMEQFAKAVPVIQRTTPLLAASDSYRSTGDEPNELRVLASVFSVSGLDTTRQQRFFQLLLAHQPQELVHIASTWPMPSGEQAANYVVAHGGERPRFSVWRFQWPPRTLPASSITSWTCCSWSLPS